jgi:hypothetical protein
MNWNRLLMVILCLVTLIGSNQARAELYGWHDAYVFRLGQGFDRDNIFEGKQTIVTSTGIDRDQAGASIKFELSEIRSVQELTKILNLNVSANAKYSFFKGSGQIDLHNEYTYDADSLVYVVKMEADYGRFFLRNPSLPDKAKKLPLADFIDRYGTHYIDSEKRGAFVSLVFSIHNTSSFSRSELQTLARAAFSGLNTKVNLSVAHQQAMEELAKRSSIDLKISTFGGPDLPELAPLLTSYDDFTTLKEHLQQFVKSMKVDLARPTEFESKSYKTLGLGVPPIPDQNEAVLIDLHNIYYDLQFKKKRLEEIVNEAGSKYAHLSKEQIQEYIGKLDEINGYIDAIVEAAQGCKPVGESGGSDSCKKPKLPAVILVNWPNPQIIVEWTGLVAANAWEIRGVVRGGTFERICPVMPDGRERWCIDLKADDNGNYFFKTGATPLHGDATPLTEQGLTQWRLRIYNSANQDVLTSYIYKK